MTFVKTLKTATVNGFEITVTENTEKFENVPYYQIVVSKNAIAIDIYNTAKSTYCKKFSQIVASLER